MSTSPHHVHGPDCQHEHEHNHNLNNSAEHVHGPDCNHDHDHHHDHAPIAPHVNPLRSVGRNDACPCGSGQKFKKCHGR